MLTLQQAAEHLQVSRRTVEREIADGRLAVVEIRGCVRIDDSELQDYIRRSQKTKERRCQSGSAAIDGMCDFRSAANSTNDLLDRLLQKQTRSRSRRGCAPTSSTAN